MKNIIFYFVSFISIIAIFLGCAYLEGTDQTGQPAPEEIEPPRIEALLVEPIEELPEAEAEEPEIPEPVIEPTVYYELTPEELDLVQRVVMAESGGEPYEGQMAVAQCIINACLKDGIRPAEAIKRYQYTKNRPEPSYSVKNAVEAVFTNGEKAVDGEILYFYAPALCTSQWHETQIYICTIGNHRFFEERC